MLDKIKSYFNIQGDSMDDALQAIIDQSEALVKELGTNPVLVWNICLELVENYLRTGIGNSFTTDNANAALQVLSPQLMELIRVMTPAKVYPCSDPEPPKPDPIPPYKTISKTTLNGLYSINYDNNPKSYKDADAYFHDKYNPSGCSAFYNNYLVGRAFDFYSWGNAKLLVNFKPAAHYFPSIGIVDGIKELTPALLDSGIDSPIYDYVPYMIVTGLNSKHLYCNVNMLSGPDYPPCTGTDSTKPNLCSTLVTKVILDQCSDISEVKNVLSQYNIYDPDTPTLNCTYQWVVVSPTGIVLVHLRGNKLHVDNLGSYDPVITNFLPGDNKHHMNGLERYNLIKEDLTLVESVDDAIDLLEELKYSKTYANVTPLWPSEFYGIYDTFDWDNTVVYEDSDEAQAIYAAAQANPAWSTSHFAVADILKGELTIGINEDYEHTYKASL